MTYIYIMTMYILYTKLISYIREYISGLRLISKHPNAIAKFNTNSKLNII